MAKDIARTLKTLVRGSVAAASTVALPLLALAQGTMSPDEARKRLEADRTRARGDERRSKDLQADLDKIAVERERINGRLVETAKLVQQSEAQLSLIESRLGELDAQDKCSTRRSRRDTARSVPCWAPCCAWGATRRR